MPHRYDLEEASNVVGTCLGPKQVNEQQTDTESVIILVTQKVPKSALSRDEIVAETATVDNKELPTDVQEIGHVEYHHRSRHRPCLGGVSGHVSRGRSGTLGSPLLIDEDGDPVLLSNAHVVAREGRSNDAVYQPSLPDGGRRNDPIGVLKQSSGYDASVEPRSDSALVRVDPDDMRNDILGIGPLAGFREPAYNQTITKSGRTSGITEGELIGRDARVRISGARTPYIGLDVYSNMGTSGDSGSLFGVLDSNEFYATGLYFAGGSSRGLCIPMDAVQAVHGELTIPGRTTTSERLPRQRGFPRARGEEIVHQLKQTSWYSKITSANRQHSFSGSSLQSPSSPDSG
jgi:hypothetical protein